MRVLVAGADGYLGWVLVQHLAKRGHAVAGVDAMLRRHWVDEMGSASAIPIAQVDERITAYKEHFGEPLRFSNLNLREHADLCNVLSEFKPETIVHLAECPSAPYSMIDFFHADFVQANNASGTLSLLFAIRDHCPDAHLIKLGTNG